MATAKKVTKHEFVRHTSKYLKMSEQLGKIIITHHNKSALCLTPIKTKSIYDLKGILSECTVQGDINEPILPGYDKW